MAYNLSEISDIHHKSDRYSDKALCAWYAMYAPGAGTKRCWVPEVRYLGSGSEDKALSRCITKMFRNLGAQYTVGTFL